MKPAPCGTARRVAGVLALACACVGAPAVAAELAPELKTGLDLLTRSSGEGLSIADFLVDDAAAEVSAAAMAGVAPSAVTLAEATSDFAVFLQGLNSGSEGAGFAITPARMRKPWPRVELSDYLAGDIGARLLAGLTISLARGSADVGGVKTVRRALALSTGGVFRIADDPISVVAKAVGKRCKVDTPRPTGGDSAERQLSEEETRARHAQLQACIDRAKTRLDARWFRPLWSVSLATGDAQRGGPGSPTVSLGESLAVAVRYGAGASRKRAEPAAKPADPADDEYDWGWAISASVKAARREPLPDTLAAGPVVRQNSRVAALRLAAGNDVWRAVVEGSDAGTKSAQAGDRTLRQALGVDYRLGKGTWLNFRYGKRNRYGMDGEERASLLSLTLSPTMLAFGR